MKKKVVTHPSHFLDENYQMLANAICTQAARDYEYLISDRQAYSMRDSDRYCNLTELKDFAKRQTYTEVNMLDVLNIIDRNYKKRFRPYVEEHYEEIIANWRDKKMSKRDWNYKVANHPYFCPNCGGVLYPGTKQQASQDYIVCTGCNLNMRIPQKKGA